MTGDAAERQQVVIVGAGFTGLEAAKILVKRKDVAVTIIDRHNYHLFQPLLYQVATAGLAPANIATPIRAIMSHTAPYSEVLLAEVQGIDAEKKEVLIDRGERVPYDYLLLGTGARHAYFGRDDWEVFAPGLKTLDDATEIRRRILLAFERAEREKVEDKRRAYMTFVIVGAGPTGVELAGAIAELARFALAKDFHVIRPEQTRVILLEGSPRVLAAFPEDLSAKAQRSLEKLGVEVRTGARVTDINGDGVFMGSEFLPAKTAIWAAGVTASSLGAKLGVSLDKSGRVLVAPDLSVPGRPEIFVGGDLASFKHGDEQVPGVAPAAMQMGRQAARNIVAAIEGKPTRPFKYLDKGNLATIGRAKAVAEIGRVHLAGYFAWWVWLVVHIAYLIGFRSKVIVTIEWAWNYLTFGRGSRLIFGAMRRLPTGKTPGAPAS